MVFSSYYGHIITIVIVLKFTFEFVILYVLAFQCLSEYICLSINRYSPVKSALGVLRASYECVHRCAVRSLHPALILLICTFLFVCFK